MSAREDTLDIIPNDFMRFVKNGRVIQGTWKKKENHKIYAIWLGILLGFKTMEDWYNVTVKVFHDNRGGGLLTQYYKNSPLKFLQSVFPSDETKHIWLPWKFKVTGKGIWDDEENRKTWAIYFGKQLGYKKPEDWYKLEIKDFNKIKNGMGLLAKYYNDSPLEFLESVFPEESWLPWKFTVAANNTWKNKDGTFNMKNHIKYANFLGKIKGFKNPEDWYDVTQKDFIDNNGGGLLNKYYNGSPLKFLESVFSEEKWLPWKFAQSANNTWKNKDGTFNIENHVKYANFIMSKFNFKTMEEWYKTNRKVLQDNHGGGLLSDCYEGSIKLFATTIYPDYPWDLSKFKKNYSQGQIEWLNCLIIKKYPDIRHALNDNDGEYLIPNSRYHADGYSESQNMIFEYDGDFYHGNPEYNNPEELNKRTKTTYGEQYQKTLKKQRFCEESGYNYVSIWESEWFRFKNSIILLQKRWKRIFERIIDEKGSFLEKI